MEESVQPNMTSDEELAVRLLVQDTVLRYLIGLLKPAESAALSTLLNGTCENLANQPPRDSPGHNLQRAYTIHLLKSYLPKR